MKLIMSFQQAGGGIMLEAEVAGVVTESLMGMSFLTLGSAVVVWVSGSALLAIAIYQIRKHLSQELQQKESAFKRLVKCDYITQCFKEIFIFQLLTIFTVILTFITLSLKYGYDH